VREHTTLKGVRCVPGRGGRGKPPFLFDFMEFVEAGQLQKVWITHPYTGEEITVGAVWNGIIDGIWKNGEPGVLFYDEINRKNPTPQLGEIDTTNPCVTADTWVMTGDGPRQVADLVGTAFNAAANGALFRSGEAGFFSTGTKEVVRLTTKEGHCVRVTRNHPVCRVSSLSRSRMETEWTCAGDLSPGDLVLLHDHRSLPAWPGPLDREEGYRLGLLAGDGALKRDAAALSVRVRDRGAEACASTPACFAVGDPAVSYGMARGTEIVAPDLEKASSAGYCGFLSGIFDCDASVRRSSRNGISIRLAQSSFSLLRAVQRMLLRLGISSRIYRRRRAGSCRARARYELAIAGDGLPGPVQCVRGGAGGVQVGGRADAPLRGVLCTGGAGVE